MPNFDLEQAIETLAQRFADAWQRHRVAILGCIAINLAAVVALLAAQLRGTPRFAESQLFVGLEPDPVETSAPQAPAEQHAGWAREVPSSQVRNIAVDATQPTPLNAGLADEKQIDAQALYEEAARVRQQLQGHQPPAPPEARGDVDIPNQPPTQPTQADHPYRGPSVLSYHLENRKPLGLVVPAYQCEAGGGIVVIIEVTRAGLVARARIDPTLSSSDPCLQQAAIDAALRTRFNVSDQAPAPQHGSISYLFVPQ